MDNFFKSKSIEKIIMPKRAQTLSERCALNGNPIIFQGVGTNKYGENHDLENIEIKTGIAKTEEQEYLFKQLLMSIKSYLNGPIFTDNFHEKHEDRRIFEHELEEELIKKGNTKEDQETLAYYNSNRLGINRISSIVGLVDLLINDNELDDDIKNKLIKIESKFPKEFFIQKDEKFPKYNITTDSNKVEIMSKFSDLTRKMISVIKK